MNDTKPNSNPHPPLSRPTGSAPPSIWLQWDGDGEPEYGEVSIGDVTWCPTKVFAQDVEYIRADEILPLMERLATNTAYPNDAWQWLRARMPNNKLKHGETNQ